MQIHAFGRSLVGLLLLLVPAAAQLRPAQVFILLGPPGSGKSVQAGILSKEYKIPAISMADLLKQEIRKKNPLSRTLAASIASGELVSDEAANQVMMPRLLQPDAGKGFILDGYPTTDDQAKALDAFLKEQGFPKPVVVILQASDDVLRQRLKKRGRADDKPENVDRRLREYRDHEAFTENHYGTESTARVDGSGSVQTVAQAVATGIDNVHSKRKLLVRPPSEGLKQRDPQ